MKNLWLFIVFFFTTAFTFAQSHVWVNGYTRSNGTTVQGHYRTAPDNTITNNWSTVGNVNPYTGKAGTVMASSSYNTTDVPRTYISTYKPVTYIPKTYTTTATCAAPIREIYYSSPTYYQTPSYSTTSTIYTGPRGGNYYINGSGNKTYVSRN
jgi:hypothetical protein